VRIDFVAMSAFDCTGSSDDHGSGCVTAAVLSEVAPIRAELAFGVMSEKKLAVFSVSALGFVALMLVASWFILGLLD